MNAQEIYPALLPRRAAAPVMPKEGHILCPEASARRRVVLGRERVEVDTVI